MKETENQRRKDIDERTNAERRASNASFLLSVRAIHTCSSPFEKGRRVKMCTPGEMIDFPSNVPIDVSFIENHVFNL